MISSCRSGGNKVIETRSSSSVGKPGFLHVTFPDLNEKGHSLNPLKYVQERQNGVKRRINLSSIYLTELLLESVRKYRGPKDSILFKMYWNVVLMHYMATAEYIHRTQKNSSMSIKFDWAT
ncbi:O-acyltransferase, WSD1 domain-containing protein [Artemisia annua]|uniref:O-acyltransferase, WSD1 domain-containing protein n=1 Tax=Artemisia annua TaxID=35608 RepID=A0A2U1KQD3_ARTAN|nr:O-acyltransferase, WSD1 domain-containing protein [Artemisia annua]